VVGFAGGVCEGVKGQTSALPPASSGVSINLSRAITRVDPLLKPTLTGPRGP
jgi:hypothetical protein